MQTSCCEVGDVTNYALGVFNAFKANKICHTKSGGTRRNISYLTYMYYWNIETLSTDHGCVFASGKQSFFLCISLLSILTWRTYLFVIKLSIFVWFREKILTTQLNISTGISLTLVYSSTNMSKSVWTSGFWKSLVHKNMSNFWNNIFHKFLITSLAFAYFVRSRCGRVNFGVDE